MGAMDNIMAFKDHYGFKFAHGRRYPRQSKDKVFVFKMSMDLSYKGVNLVKWTHVAGVMENTWIIFNHVKILKELTTIACQVYDNIYCKVLMIECCNMQSKDIVALNLVFKKTQCGDSG